MITRIQKKVTRWQKRSGANTFRRLACMWSSPAPFVYDWSDWDVTLLRNIAPRARRIRASFMQDPRELAERLPASAKMLIVHLDISDNSPFIADPSELVRVMNQRGVRVLNANARDIRKTTVQSSCASFGLATTTASLHGEPDELLIVKTDLNTAGTREQLLPADLRARFHLPPAISRLKNREGYHVARRAELGADVWNDPDLVVQRFINNPAGRFFRVYALLDAVVISEGYTDLPLKRMTSGIRRYNHRLWRHGETLAPRCGTAAKLPSALLRTAGIFFQRFNLDFAAIDIAEGANDEFCVIDANKTPFWENEHQPGLLEHLRSGLKHSRKELRPNPVRHGV